MLHWTLNWLKLAIFPLMAALGAVIMASVYFVEHVLGYPPCPMCLWQRLPWFFLVIVALLGSRFEKRRLSTSVRLCQGLMLACLLVSFILAAYHTGVEWRWWEGPSSCSGVDLDASFDELKQSLLAKPPVRCDEVEFRILGASLALWNAVVSGTALVLLVVLLATVLAGQRGKLNHV